MSEKPAKAARAEGANANSYRQPTTKEIVQSAIEEGPFSVLDSAVKYGMRVFVQCRYSKSLVAKVLAYDKHFNLVLRDVTELTNVGDEVTERVIKNMFLRGDSVIFIVKINESDA